MVANVSRREERGPGRGVEDAGIARRGARAGAGTCVSPNCGNLDVP